MAPASVLGESSALFYREILIPCSDQGWMAWHQKLLTFSGGAWMGVESLNPTPGLERPRDAGI